MSETVQKKSNTALQIATRPPSGVRTEKERKAIELRYLGRSSQEISEVTGFHEAHVRKLFMSGGRLQKLFEEYSFRQQTKGQDQADQVLNRAREEAANAIERMISLSKDSSNGPVAYKATEFLLNISGTITGSSLQAFLSGKSFEEVKRICDEASTKLFGKPLSGFQLMIDPGFEKATQEMDEKYEIINADSKV